jgi:hypothetical protein
MAFVAVASSVGVAVGLGGTAAIIGGGALIGAGVGGLYSAFTGDGDILNSMLTGGLIGGAGAFGLNAMGVGAAPAVTAPTALASAPVSTTLVPTANAMTATPALQATGLKAAASAAPGISAIPAASTFGSLAVPTAAAAPSLASLTTPVVTGSLLPAGYGAASTAAGASGAKMLGYGLAGTTALSLLGGKQKGPGAGQMPDPGMIRPYDYSSTPNEPTGTYPSPYATAQYNEAGNPILDTRERNYFSQGFSPMQPYSAKPGTANPNTPVTMAARGGLMFDDESGMDEARGMMQGNLQKGLFGMGYAEGGEVDLDQERNKLIIKNIKSASTKDLEKIMGAINQQEFLMKNMPNYAQAMSPSISGMVEGAQYGDRMAKSYGGQPRDINVMPTMVDPQSGMYGGIASIGRQIDPNTRVNAMANIQRTPYDRNAMESVRRLGVGVDRQLGRDTNLSAFYEQDPMGRDKMGGARLTQRFEEGGLMAAGGQIPNLGSYSDGGRMLKGPGDGMSDDIPGVIGNKQPARLADGEFVVPADVVSHLGNGSTDAGAKRLYAMMDTVRKARTGTKKQGKKIKAEKYLPA